MTTDNTEPLDLPGLAAWVHTAAAELADGLGALAGSVRAADGQHIDLGPGTAAKRVAARDVADAAESARDALTALGARLDHLADVWRAQDGG